MGKTEAATDKECLAKMGRRPTYKLTDHVDDICEWISRGKTLRDWCRQEGKPSFHTVYEWRANDEDFARRFARAREIGFDAIAEQAWEIADDDSGDVTYRAGKNGEEYETMDTEFVARSRLRVETRLKLLAKWDPKRYGDRQHVEHEGGVQIQVVTGVPPAKADGDSSS